MENTPIEVYEGIKVKRDDLYGSYPNVGGKVRGARRLFQKLHGKYTGVVGYGSAISNHLRITACTAAEYNLRSIVVFPNDSTYDDTNIQIAKQAGSQLLPSSSKTIPELAALASKVASERRWYLVPWGMKCRETVDSFREETLKLPQQYDHIIIACGTGASMAGVAEGLKETGAKTKLWAICIGRSSRKVMKGLRSVVDITYPNLQFVNLGNYGQIAHMIPPFPCDLYYDAKAWEALHRLSIKGDILFWNLGGWSHQSR